MTLLGTTFKRVWPTKERSTFKDLANFYQPLLLSDTAHTLTRTFRHGRVVYYGKTMEKHTLF